MEMAVFSAVLAGGGWTRGEVPEASLLMAASGAAFTAVVLGQLANAFACRSATVPPWKLGWGTNRLLVWAVLAEVAILAVCLYVPSLAALLGQSPPPPEGLLLAVLAAPAVLLADWIHKSFRAHLRRSKDQSL